MHRALVAFVQQRPIMRNSHSCLPWNAYRVGKCSFGPVCTPWNTTNAWHDRTWDLSKALLIGKDFHGRLGKNLVVFAGCIDARHQPKKHMHCISCNGENQCPNPDPSDKCCNMGNGKSAEVYRHTSGRCDRSTSQRPCRAIHNLDWDIYLPLVARHCTSYTWLPLQHICPVAHPDLLKAFPVLVHSTNGKCTIDLIRDDAIYLYHTRGCCEQTEKSNMNTTIFQESSTYMLVHSVDNLEQIQ